MRKNELIAFVADQSDMPLADAERAVETIFGEIGAALARGETVSLVGFGSFERRQRSARRGKNPQTGASIDIAASANVGFRPGKLLRDALN